MPELPEVETVVRGLGRHLIGQTIKDVEVRNSNSFKVAPKLRSGRVILKNLRVIKITRRGKGIIINLRQPGVLSGVAHAKTEAQKSEDGSKSLSLLIHLKMTGQLIYVPTIRHSGKRSASRIVKTSVRSWDESVRQLAETKRLNFGHPTSDFTNTMPSQHTRVIFELSKGTLYFNDQRKFGWVKVIPTEKVNEDPFIKNLGVEPFSKSFTPEFLWDVIKKRPKTNIKATLLDQSVVVGIGNIYASEILFSAKIDPHKKNNQITKFEVGRIIKSTREVLKKGIKYSGTSILNYKTPEGSPGKMQNYLKVYSRDKLPCRACKTIIKKVRSGGRSTYYCPNCQR